MDKILKVALGTIFPKENIDNILEVIHATPSSDVATAILLGIYEEPALQPDAVINDKDCTLVSYNKWNDQVRYSYLVNDTKHIYIAKDTDTKLITEDNYQDYMIKYSDNCTGFNVKLKAMRTVTSDCYSSTWNEKPRVVPIINNIEDFVENNYL
jgi:hypothetical protein